MSRNPRPGDDRAIEAAERRARVVALRRQRRTFADIGNELGVSAQRAHQLYWEAVEEVPAAEVHQHRAEELILIDDAIADLLMLAKSHRQPRTAVEAWNSIRGWAERKAKLLGLDAPTRAEIGGKLSYEIIGVDLEQL